MSVNQDVGIEELEAHSEALTSLVGFFAGPGNRIAYASAGWVLQPRYNSLFRAFSLIVLVDKLPDGLGGHTAHGLVLLGGVDAELPQQRHGEAQSDVLMADRVLFHVNQCST